MIRVLTGLTIRTGRAPQNEKCKVLKTLFRFMKPKDLKACRLVCMRWNVLTLPFSRTTFVATIFKNKFTDFVQRMESNTLGIPITKFRLGSFDPTVGIGQTFLQHYGEIATKVDLWETGETHMVENVGALLRSFTRLESFKMPRSFGSVSPGVVKLFPGPEIPPEYKCLKTFDIGGGPTENQREICPTFFEEFLGAAKNISALFIDDGFIIKDGPGSLEVLKILENLGRESSLEVLSMSHVSAAHLEVLEKMTVKPRRLILKHLRVNWRETLSDMSFLELIALLNDSLISLHCALNGQQCCPIRFPRMPKLKLLNFEIFNCEPSKYLELEDLGNRFPALQHLVLNCDRSLDELSIGSESCPALESLNIHKLTVSVPTFQRILNVCPNLSELEIHLDDRAENILEMIWSQVPRLQKLKMCGVLSTGDCVDSVLTGILTEGRKRVLNSKLGPLKNVTPEGRRDAIQKLIDEYGVFPSIRNLTNLQHLTLSLEVDDWQWSKQQTFLTDLTGYLGLYSMKNLQSLNISPCKLSKACSEILVQDLGLHSWNIQSERKVNIIPPKWNSDDNHQGEFASSRFSFNYAL